MSESVGHSSTESGDILDWALVDSHGDLEVTKGNNLLQFYFTTTCLTVMRNNVMACLPNCFTR